MKVRRIFNKEEKNNYFVIIKKSSIKTVVANNECELTFLLNSNQIDEEEFKNCQIAVYSGRMEVY